MNRRYQWKEMYENVVNFVKTCDECQKWAWIRQEEPLHSIWTKTMWNKIDVNVVKFSMSSKGYKFAVFARDDLSGWSEGRVLKMTNSKSVAKFLFEEVIYRYEYSRRIVMNDKSENKKIIKILLKHYWIKQINISIYHSQSNRLVKCDHDIIINSFFKYCKNNHTAWICHLSLIL